MTDLLNDVLRLAENSTNGIEEYMVYIWLGVFALACLIELFTTKLIAVWFAGASVLSLILSFIPPVPSWGEIIAFVLLLPLLFVFVRPRIERSLQKKQKDKEKDGDSDSTSK